MSPDDSITTKRPLPLTSLAKELRGMGTGVAVGVGVVEGVGVGVAGMVVEVT
jgi:hypothetical protein